MRKRSIGEDSIKRLKRFHASTSLGGFQIPNAFLDGEKAARGY
jgi:hypothetical protein